MLPRKIEQIAYAADDPSLLMQRYRKIGAKTWIHDQVSASGLLDGLEVSNTADLFFNYDFGYELEIIKYHEGSPSWHSLRNKEGYPIFQSHMGLHVNRVEMNQIIRQMQSASMDIIQEVQTFRHTNENIKDERRYHYVIFDSIDILGFDLKLIERLKLDGSPFIQ